MPEGKCSVCKENLPDDNAYLHCTNGCKLHFECGGLSASSWKSMSKPTKNAWKCPDCRGSKGDNASVRDKDTDDLKIFMKNVLGELQELKVSVQNMTNNHQKVLEELTGQRKDIQQLKQEVASLTDKLQVKDQEIESLRLKARDSEQYSRNRNIAISGIQYQKDEDLLEIMDTLAEYLNIPGHNRDDIDVLHRVPAKKDKDHPKIIVQFKSRTKRDRWLVNKKHGLKSFNVVGSSGSKTDETPVYINEHLTREWLDLLMKAKVEGKKYGYQRVWFKSYVRAKKSDSDQTFIKIASEADLAKLRV